MLKLSAAITASAFMLALSTPSFAADVNSDSAAPSNAPSLNSGTPSSQGGNSMQQRIRNGMRSNRDQSAQMPDESDSKSDSDNPEATRGMKDQDSQDSGSSLNKTLNRTIEKVRPNSSSPPSTSSPGP